MCSSIVEQREGAWDVQFWTHPEPKYTAVVPLPETVLVVPPMQYILAPISQTQLSIAVFVG